MADFIIENGVLVKYKGGKRSVYIPSEVARIGKYALAGCEKTEIVTIRDGVTGIDEGAFMKCFYLREIVIPESISMIGVRAFADCRRSSRHGHLIIVMVLEVLFWGMISKRLAIMPFMIAILWRKL